MASAYLVSAAPNDPKRFPKAFLDLEQLRTCSRVDRFGVHSTTDDPSEADLILFVEVSGGAGHYFERVRRHPLYRANRAKTYLFSSTDKFVPLLPGVYASLERSWYSPEWCRPGHYLGVRESGDMRYDPRHPPPSYLFSYVGSTNTHPIRKRLMQLDHSDALLIDTSTANDEQTLMPSEYERRYACSIRQSAFVLCPRGGGTSSLRLFETMMLGRVPVVVSDEWVPPEGPDWETFSVSVKQSEIATIPAVLAERESEARAMGLAARAAWLDWFSETSSFHRIIEWCLQLAPSAPSRAGYRRYAPYRQMLRPFHATRWIAKRLGHGRVWSI
jgi:Exostosin family